MSAYGFPTQQFVVASGILSGVWVGAHPGFAEATIINGVGDYSVFLAEPLDELSCRVFFTDHRQAPLPADTLFGYSRPSATEIRITSSTPAGVPADRDIDVLVIGILPT